MRWLLLALFLAFPASADGINDDRSAFYQLFVDGMDDVGPSATFIAPMHHEIREGDAFTAAYFAEGVADDANICFALTTAATKQVHIVVSSTSGGDASLTITENPSIGGGSVVTPVDFNRTTANTSGITLVHTPTTNTGGTILISEFVGGGEKNFSSGGSGGGRTEFVLKASTSYTFLLKNLAGAAKPLGMMMEWYEHS